MPIWIDSDVDIENDPYKSDCISETTVAQPHAYTNFEITNGEMTSKNCIEKPPGENEYYQVFNSNNNNLVYSSWNPYSVCSVTCGDGQKTRTRTCVGGICSLATPQDFIQTDTCNERDCK